MVRSGVTCDGHDVQKSPHALRTDVTEPVLRHHQLGQIKGHLTSHRALDLTPSVRVLSTEHQKHVYTHTHSLTDPHTHTHTYLTLRVSVDLLPNLVSSPKLC